MLSMSLDVIFHLVEDAVYETYMRTLFGAAIGFVIIYSSNTEEEMCRFEPHIRHRKFTNWININLDDWRLIDFIPNANQFSRTTGAGSFSNFYIYANAQSLPVI